jgi:hypothetical protein
VWREIEWIISAAIILPLVGMVVVLVGQAVGDLWDSPKVPRWRIYAMFAVIGFVVIYGSRWARA